MDKQEIIKVQNRILDLSPNRSGIYLKYCCSEISRLIIRWLWSYDKTCKFYILKGSGAMDGKMSHDILVVNKDNIYSIIDPTIWQFFPDAKSILAYEGIDLEKGIDNIKRKYKCNWVLGKQEEIPDDKTAKEYTEIIKSIINDNLKESTL